VEELPRDDRLEIRDRLPSGIDANVAVHGIGGEQDPRFAARHVGVAAVQNAPKH